MEQEEQAEQTSPTQENAIERRRPGILVRAIAAGVVGFILIIAIWWVASAPPAHLVIAPAYIIGETRADLLAVWAEGDPIGETMTTFAENIPGYDDVVLQEHLGRAFVTGRDGWIWKVDLETREAEQFVDVPLMAAGAHELPGDDDVICFCSSFLYETEYPEDERVGLYQLDVRTKEVTPLLLRVPIPPEIAPWREGDEITKGIVFTEISETRLALADMNDANSRPIAFCNDFDISADGKRFYFSEPFAYEGASMGGGAVGEAISMGNNGRLWSYDAETESAALVAQEYNFIDGVLIEDLAGGREQSVLVTETTKFRILRLFISGDRAGQEEVVWDALPALADGLERDAEGNIWVGMIKQRSGLLTWAHANPWIKPLMLRLPLELLPVPTVTGVMALSPDAATPLWYAEHPGTHVHDIAAVIPGEEGIYLANFSDETPGLHRIENPLK